MCSASQPLFRTLLQAPPQGGDRGPSLVPHSAKGSVAISLHPPPATATPKANGVSQPRSSNNAPLAFPIGARPTTFSPAPPPPTPIGARPSPTPSTSSTVVAARAQRKPTPKWVAAMPVPSSSVAAAVPHHDTPSNLMRFLEIRANQLQETKEVIAACVISRNEATLQLGATIQQIHLNESFHKEAPADQSQQFAARLQELFNARMQHAADVKLFTNTVLEQQKYLKSSLGSLRCTRIPES